jgi:hypothetical protein
MKKEQRDTMVNIHAVTQTMYIYNETDQSCRHRGAHHSTFDESLSASHSVLFALLCVRFSRLVTPALFALLSFVCLRINGILII